MRPGVVVGVAIVTIGLACASEGFPPGGPEDKVPPVLIASDPAERAVNAEPNQPILLEFDEIIDERLADQIGDFILINPDVPEFEAQLDDNKITLTSQEPLLDGVTYSVTILPGLEDRDRNATVTPKTILFSVGGEVPITLSLVRVTIVKDTLPAAGAQYRLENEELELGYTWEADSQGQIEIEAVEYGRYVATAWEEMVRPEGWQETEEPGARDTFELSIESRLHEKMYRIAVVDTTAPLVDRVRNPTSRRVVVVFDDQLPELLPLIPSMVALYEASPEIWDVDTDPEELPLEQLRGRRLEIENVERTGTNEVRVTSAEPLRTGRLYRIEIIDVVNVSGLISTAEGGRVFRASYDGAAKFRSEPLEIPDGGL